MNNFKKEILKDGFTKNLLTAADWKKRPGGHHAAQIIINKNFYLSILQGGGVHSSGLHIFDELKTGYLGDFEVALVHIDSSLIITVRHYQSPLQIENFVKDIISQRL